MLLSALHKTSPYAEAECRVRECRGGAPAPIAALCPPRRVSDRWIKFVLMHRHPVVTSTVAQVAVPLSALHGAILTVGLNSF